MSDFYDVDLDLDLLFRNLRSSGQAQTVAEVVRIMTSCGFQLLESGLWRCEAESLRCLIPGEFRLRRLVGTAAALI